MNRREFLGAAMALPLMGRMGRTYDPLVRFGAEVFDEFDYDEVELTRGPLKEQYDRVHSAYLALDNDRLLKVYRERAGLPAPGADMGGWYAADGFVPGHSLGQYISGLARIGRTTGDSACSTKVDDLVSGFAATMGDKNRIFAGPNAEKVWPCYILDKHLVGLIDAFRLSGVEQGRELLPRVFEGALAFIPDRGRDRVGKKDPPYDETYVLPENLFEAYALTGERALHERAVAYLLDKDFFDPLAAGVDVLPGRHAYSHVIALSSAGKARLVLGNDRYLETMRNAYRILTSTQQYASGGWGPNETFIEPHKGQLYESLHGTVDHFETPCGSYAAIKLARYLLRATGDARYGDGLERVLYNGLLAVKEPDSDGDYPYYSTYSDDAEKVYYPRKWPCCSGTLVQGVADYVKNIYFKSQDGVAVNLYASSRARWEYQERPVQLSQDASDPADGTVHIRLECSETTEMTLRLRVPGWLERSPEFKVNGINITPEKHRGFAIIRRRWKNGDVVSAEFEQAIRTEPIDDLHPETVAVMRGPLMYVQESPAEGPARLPNLEGLRSKAEESEASRANEGDRSKRLVPFYQVKERRYTTYFNKG